MAIAIIACKIKLFFILKYILFFYFSFTRPTNLFNKRYYFFILTIIIGYSTTNPNILNSFCYTGRIFVHNIMGRTYYRITIYLQQLPTLLRHIVYCLHRRRICPAVLFYQSIAIEFYFAE